MWEGRELTEDDLASGDLVEGLVDDVRNGRLETLTLVEKLGPTLTSTTVEVRTRGVRLLADVLRRLPHDFLSGQQIAVVADFYIARLGDNHNVVPAALAGLDALVAMKHLPGDVAPRVCRCLFESVPCQQQVRTDRHLIYSILFKIVSDRLEDVKSIELEFVLGLILSMDGERDPRNLLYLFSILPTFLKALNLGHVTEEMFEVMACYFPVDFTAPQDDANAITRDDLADRLSICLCAVPSFAEFSIPLLLEKLGSDLKVAKTDALKLLKQSCSTFSAQSFESHLHNIWKALQREIAQDNDQDLLNCAHEALSELINNLYADTSNISIAETFLKEIIITLQSLLCDAKIRSRFEAPLKVMLTIAKASERSCVFIVKHMNYHLKAHFQTNTEDKLKILILEYFIQLFDACKHWNIENEVNEDFKFLFELIISINDSRNLELKLCGYNSLSKIAELLTSNESLVFQEILNYNINHETSEKVFDMTKICLLSLAKQHPSVYEHFVNELLVLDPIKFNKQLLKRKAQCACYVSSIDAFTKVVFEQILNFITDNEMEISIVVIESIISALKCSELYKVQKCIQIETEHNFVERLVNWIMLNKVYSVPEVQECISEIIMLVMRILTVERQNHIHEQLLLRYKNEFLEGDESSIIVLEALLNSSRENSSMCHMEWVLARSFKTAMFHHNFHIQQKGCKLLANFFNKYINDIVAQGQYEIFKREILKTLESKIEDDIHVKNAILLASWLTKCFMHNGYPESLTWFYKLVELISDEKLGIHAAKGISLIMNEEENVLSKSSNCKVSFLYRQRVFQLFLLKVDHSKSNPAYLQAWSYIIQSVPKTVLLMELPKISNVLVECLNLHDTEVLIAVLGIVSYLIQHKKSICAIQTLLPRCLHLCSKTFPAKVRAASLQCIYDIANNCPTYQLLTHKQDMAIELFNYLDDPKRIVRSVAVKARTRWFLVGSPGEDKDK